MTVFLPPKGEAAAHIAILVSEIVMVRPPERHIVPGDRRESR